MRLPNSISWNLGHFPVALSRSAVHVWSFPLRCVHAEDEQTTRKHGNPEQWRVLLSHEECARADRFKVLRAKEDFLVARGMLRWITAELLGNDPRGLRFEAGPFGKPALVRRKGAADVRFNLSHTGELGVLAITAEQEIGIDVEMIRQIRDAVAIGERQFTTGEQELLREAEKSQTVPQTFLRLWTRKEALLKASGQGLSLSLNSFDVSWRDEEGTLHFEGPNPVAWSLFDFSPAAGYCGALAIEHCGFPPAIHYWTCEWPRLI